jgi:chlorobactene glucosyltransferase
MDSFHLTILFILFVLGMNLFQNLKKIEMYEGIQGDVNTPLVSILVPARNEEGTIEECVESLLQSDYPLLEIVVLDDNSRDRTFAIIRRLSQSHANLRVIKGKKLPPGWNGKNWACHQLAQSAGGEWFLFTDADTCHSPHSVSSALEAARRCHSDFVTAIPGLTMKTWSEKLVLPVIHFAFFTLLPYNIMNFRRNCRLAIGIGPFLFMSRDCYFSCGGFEAIKTEILDDMALAKKVKQNNRKISVIDGTGFMTVRFYTSFKEVWAGLSKNSFQAIGGSPHFLLGISLACYFLFIYPYISLGSAILDHQSLTLPLLQLIVISLIKIAMAARFKTSVIYGLLHPFMIILILLILFNSFRLSFFGKQFEWKERLYPVK